MSFERLYPRLPVGLQNLAVSYEGWRIQQRRYAPAFHATLRTLEAQSFLSPEEVARVRDERLSRFIEHAVRHVPYYRDLFRERGLAPADIRGLDDLQALPILDNRAVRENPARFMAEGGVDEPTLVAKTSGSTGSPLKFPYTPSSHREQWAVWWRFRRWHGLELHEPCMVFGGRSVVPITQRRPPYWRTNRPGRQLLFSAYHLGPETAPAYLERMKRCGMRWIHGFPSQVALLARYALELKVTLPIRWVTLGSENMLPPALMTIEQAFGVKPLHHYGMAEGVANISLCPHGALHVDEDYAATEFIPRGNGAAAVVGTNFTNPAYPLLRYDVGDLITLSDHACDCGRPGRVVGRIDGRQDDYVITARGVRLGRLGHVFRHVNNIQEAQIRQREPGKITIRIVPRPGFSAADEQRLAAQVRERMGDDMGFEIEQVDSLPRTASGKLRLVVTELEESRIDREPIR